MVFWLKSSVLVEKSSVLVEKSSVLVEKSSVLDFSLPVSMVFKDEIEENACSQTMN